jgi:NAD(P)H-dependent FMN reductase
MTIGVHPDRVHVAVIVASTREGRFAESVADWFLELASRRLDLWIDPIDLARTQLPYRLPPRHPRGGEYPPEVEPFAERVGRAEGYIVITPEYNHGYPGSLKNALDLVNAEWRAKPVGFVSYGGVSGGIRAVEQLRQVVVELHMVPIRDGVVLPLARQTFGEDGPADPDGMIRDSVGVMFDRMVWWARALGAARRASPYDGVL